MHAIQQVIREIKKLGVNKNSQEAQDLQQLVNGANNYLQSTELLNTQPVPRVNQTQHSSASEKELDDRKMKQSLPRVSQPTACDKMPHNDGPPISRTQSKTANIRVENAVAAKAIQEPRHCMQKLSKHIEKMNNEVHKALGVMDTETGKVLNYRQLGTKICGRPGPCDLLDRRAAYARDPDIFPRFGKFCNDFQG